MSEHDRPDTDTDPDAALIAEIDDVLNGVEPAEVGLLRTLIGALADGDAPAEAGDGHAWALALAPNGDLARFAFSPDCPTHRLERVITMAMADDREPDDPLRVAGAASLSLGRNLLMFVPAFETDPTAELLAGLELNPLAVFATWMLTDLHMPIFGPVVFTGGVRSNDVNDVVGLSESALLFLEYAVAPTGGASVADAAAREALVAAAQRGRWVQRFPPGR